MIRPMPRPRRSAATATLPIRTHGSGPGIAPLGDNRQARPWSTPTDAPSALVKVVEIEDRVQFLFDDKDALAEPQQLIEPTRSQGFEALPFGLDVRRPGHGTKLNPERKPCHVAARLQPARRCSNALIFRQNTNCGNPGVGGSIPPLGTTDPEHPSNPQNFRETTASTGN